MTRFFHRFLHGPFQRFFWAVLLPWSLAVLPGCDNGDRRLAELANETSRRQAEQNVEMARLNREVAANNRRLVESSDNVTSLQRELQTERRTLADQYRHESLLAPIVSTLGSVVLCLLPLVLCLYLFHALGHESTDEGVVELLLDETFLLPPSATSASCPSLAHKQQPALSRDAADCTKEKPEKTSAGAKGMDGVNDTNGVNDTDTDQDMDHAFGHPF